MPSFPIDLLNKSNWIKVRLGDVASEYSERIDNPSESEYDDFIGSNCIDQYDFRIERTSPASQVTSAQKKFCVGDYLLVRRSLYGSDFRERAPRAQFDGVCSADIITIRENPRLIADGYLINILYSKALWDFIVSKSTGGLTRRIKWKQLADFEFLLPPKDVQTKISNLLWASYDMKMSYKAMLSSVDEYVKSQFIGQFGSIVADKKLSDIAEIYDGVHQTPHYTDSGVKFISVEDISDIYASKKYISIEDYSKYKHVPDLGDLIMTRIGTIGM